MEPMTWLQYAATHKPNIWGYYRWRRHRILQSETYYQIICEKVRCNYCGFKDWCYYEPWPQKLMDGIRCFPYTFYEKIFSPAFTWYWRHFRKGKYLTCSVCGWKEDRLDEYTIEDLGYRLIYGRWVCHHCGYHRNDDWVEGKGNISHEEYEKFWQERVKRHNGSLEELK